MIRTFNDTKISAVEFAKLAVLEFGASATNLQQVLPAEIFTRLTRREEAVIRIAITRQIGRTAKFLRAPSLAAGGLTGLFSAELPTLGTAPIAEVAPEAGVVAEAVAEVTAEVGATV